MSNSLQIIDKKSPWYKDGLSFNCTECGHCCTGSPGYVWVTDDEIAQMADHLKLQINDFIRHFVRRIDGKLALVEMAKKYDCIFLKNRKCSIYSVRPKQCRTFPWWPQNLKSEKDWDKAAKYCEGIQKNAPVVPLTTIEKQLSIHIGETS